MSGKTYFENASWRLTDDGLSHKDGVWDIFPGQVGLLDREGLFEAPLRIVGKSWFKLEDFAPAFVKALQLFGVKADASLLITFAKVGQEMLKEEIVEYVSQDLEAQSGASGGLPFMYMEPASVLMDEVTRRTGIQFI